MDLRHQRNDQFPLVLIPPVEIEPVTMTVDRTTLYRSDRGKTGMIYTEVGYVDAG